MASSDRPLDSDPRGVTPPHVTRGPSLHRRAIHSLGGWRSDGAARWVFIWPSVVIILFLSIFPLVASLTLAFSRLVFAKGRIEVDFVGLQNFQILLFGTERTHLLGVLKAPTPLGWVVFGVGAAFIIRALVTSLTRGRVRPVGAILRVAGAVLVTGLLSLVIQTLFSEGGRPGSLVVTIVYVLAGIVVQFLLGLGLALLAVQPLPGRRFFRVVFLLPMMITPVGVAYLFRMLTDTSKGPFYPIWNALGLANTSWVTNPWGARAAVMIGDIWQWTPFMFIVLVAALESQSVEPVEAAVVDGASRWQIFWEITLPEILPVSSTLILIRLIEAFKIVDLPNVMTNGGPGTATESLTLHAYTIWRTLDIGGSAAVAYMLLLIVTFIGVAYANLIRQRLVERA